jgi:hypothetical protein
VIPLHAVGELAEEYAGLLIGRERGGEVGGEGHLLRGVRDGQGDADGISALQPDGLADGSADAELNCGGRGLAAKRRSRQRIRIYS